MVINNGDDDCCQQVCRLIVCNGRNVKPTYLSMERCFTYCYSCRCAYL